jgi:hypothetical protein
VEDGTEAAVEEGADIYHAPVIENQEADTLWYSLYFVSRGTQWGFANFHDVCDCK